MAASDYQRAAQKRYRDKRKRDPEALLYHLRYQMRANAKKRAEAVGLPFSLSVHDIVIPEVCPVFGIPLAAPTGEKKKRPARQLPKPRPDSSGTGLRPRQRPGYLLQGKPPPQQRHIR